MVDKGGIIAKLYELDYEMFDLWVSYVEDTYSIWMQNMPGANNGQIALAAKHLEGAFWDHMHAAIHQWPYGEEPYMMMDRMYSSYNPMVVMRTWSDTIDQMIDHMVECWEEANELQTQHEEYCERIGAEYPPHSVSDGGGWQGSPM